jgi:hypothetical protein
VTIQPGDRASASRKRVGLVRSVLLAVSLLWLAVTAWAADPRVIQVPQGAPAQLAPPRQPVQPAIPPAQPTYPQAAAPQPQAPAAVPMTPAPPSPTPAETQANPPQSQPAEPDRNGQPDRRGTAEAPLVVELQNPPTAAPPAAANTAEAQRWASIEWWLLALAAAVIGLAVLQLLAFLFQGAWLRRTLRSAENSFAAIERALIVGTRFEATRLARDDRIVGYRVSMVFTNTGRTAAKNLASNGTFVTFDGEVPGDFDYRNRVAASPGFGVLGPGVALPLTLDIAVQDVIAVRDKRKVLLLYGWVEYHELLSPDRRRSEFCAKLDVTGNPAAADGVGGLNFEVWGKYNAVDDDCLYAPGRNPVGELPPPAQPPA